MSQKRYLPEHVIRMLRKAEAQLGQGHGQESQTWFGTR